MHILLCTTALQMRKAPTAINFTAKLCACEISTNNGTPNTAPLEAVNALRAVMSAVQGHTAG